MSSNPQNHKTVIIGISGPSGSGKSTLAAELQKRLPGAVTVNADTYYKKELPRITSPLDGQDYPDWNHPTSIDADAMAAELDRLTAEGVPYILADGAFIFCIDELRKRFDYRVFVTATLEMRLWRRICRNIKTKGQTPEFIGGYYLACVRYREAEFSVPSRKYADFTVENETGFGNAPDVLENIIKNL